MKTTFTGLLLAAAFVSSCNQTETAQKDQTAALENQAMDKSIVAEGFKLLETNCFSCHSPNASMDNRLAPPMEAIKKHYINDNTSLEDFTRDLTTFLNNPKAENSKMPGAIQRFGLMPAMQFSKAEVVKIAHYIFNTELEKPDWFDKHYEEEKEKHGVTSKSPDSPLEAGKAIAMRTQSVLGASLKEAINTKGADYALSFCSTSAIALTDSMGFAQNAKIKRVSDKNRNPKNKANPTELAFIHATKEALQQDLDVQPKLISTDTSYVGLYPILSSEMCLQCHGKPLQDVKENTLAKIRQLYPDDLAVDYKSKELRGIWVVEMKKK